MKRMLQKKLYFEVFEPQPVLIYYFLNTPSLAWSKKSEK